MNNAEREALERFERDTRHHEMTILRDDGLYRHVQFQAPGTCCFQYDLVTWPGYLAVGGDVEHYVFRRTADMFEFFIGDGARINPYYWSEKLCGRDRRSGAQSYSEDAFRDRVLEWFYDEAREMLDVRDWRVVPDERWLGCEWLAAPYGEWMDLHYDADGRLAELEATIELRLELDDQILSGWHETHYEEAARQLLDDFEHDGHRMHDTWEWSFQAYDSSYLWCCWAIVKGIERYRAEVETRTAVAA